MLQSKLLDCQFFVQLCDVYLSSWVVIFSYSCLAYVYMCANYVCLKPLTSKIISGH